MILKATTPPLQTPKSAPLPQTPQTPPSPRSKFFEFNQKLALICLGTGILNLLLYHGEVFYALHQGSPILPDASIGTQTIITVLGSFISYCVYQFGLKNSRNKYKVDADGTPFDDCSTSTGTSLPEEGDSNGRG